MLTILSQSTTDANRDRAWSALRGRFPAWEDLRAAPRDDLEDVIRVAGLAGQKAAAIHDVLERLAAERGSLDLTHLDSMPDGEAMDYLTRFRGVGVKTAACVLCFSLRRPVLPVDTHVLRIGRRLGWLPPGGSSTAAHEAVALRVPAADRFEMHLRLIALGRAVCTARSPRCGECPLGDACPRVGVEPG